MAWPLSPCLQLIQEPSTPTPPQPPSVPCLSYPHGLLPPPTPNPDCVLPWTLPPLRGLRHSHCPHLRPQSLSGQPSTGPLRNLSRVSNARPPPGGPPPGLGPHNSPLLSSRHLELFTAWAYLFQSKGSSSGWAGLDAILHPAGPTACTEQAPPSAEWKGASPPPSAPSLIIST